MSILAAYLPHPRSLTRLQGAIGSNRSVVVASSWAGLESICAARPVDIVVLDLYADGTPNFDAVRGLRVRYANVTLVAYVSPSPDRARDLFDLGRAGVEGLLLADVDDSPRTIGIVIERAEARGAAPALRPYLINHSAPVRDAVLIAVTRAHERLNGDRLAEVVGVSRRTLSSELLRAGFPPPAKLVTWGRLVVAGQMLGDRRRSADAVARALDFPSGSAFRNTCQRYLGLRPTEIRSSGGSRVVMERFLAICGLVRRGTPRSARPTSQA